MNVSTELILKVVTEKADGGICLDDLMETLDPKGLWKNEMERKRAAVRGKLNTLKRQGYVIKDGFTWKACDIISPEKKRPKQKRIYVLYNGERRLLSELCTEQNLPYHVMKSRLAKAWTGDLVDIADISHGYPLGRGGKDGYR